MESKHAIVIDKNGNKVEFVLVDFVEKGGKINDVPHSYNIKNGESLVYEDIPAALSMLKPRWNGTNWEETATPEEIAAAQPEPTEPQPSETDVIMLAVAELYELITGGATA